MARTDAAWLPDLILLTGITGFLAHRIALDLLNAGHAVRGSLRSMDRAGTVRDALRPHLDDPDCLERLEFVLLDLSRDDGWTEAAKGCEAILHTASPFPLEQRPKDPQAVIGPAVGGTVRALRAAKAAGARRVVLTSSTAAVANGPDPGGGRPRDERDWSTEGHPGANAYVLSKTRAERAAWNEARRADLDLTVINPGFVLGPLLADEGGTSVAVAERLLKGRDPMLPDLTFEAVDVRDVSRAHLAALAGPSTVGRRYVCQSGPLSFVEMARIAREEAPGRRIPSRQAPNWLVRLLARFDPALKGIVPTLGRRQAVSSDRARAELGIDFIPPQEAARATFRALLALGR
ncbi:dihydroflavonol-4-reductase [Hasllibacter halocynthiae]|uniref:Dihydroflavonol-4-reductase n=1 Tax=Hasllibacter halocynthiae TaxID=595589 RepID=A0A2T0X3F5_9RHOB|nr:NAD-dependent epimerase/dehydratase family protein [Hasllibacter halocynthiae]PRY93435.1 dihydroflavonol-4-reductase [Hasllibacter halocynthiae]